MTWIGDVYISFITDEGFSQSRDTVERNFVDSDPTIAEFEAQLQSGDVSLVLIESTHPDNMSLENQRNGIYKLVKMPANQCPFDFLSETGHLSIDSASVPRVPELDAWNGTISVRYMPDSLYQPANIPNPQLIENDYSVTKQGTIALLNSIGTVYERDPDTGAMSQVAASDSVDIDGGTLEVYNVDDMQYVYNYPSDYTEPVRTSKVTVWKHNYSNDWTRVFNNEYSPDLVVQNGYLRFMFNDPQDFNTHMYWYDGASWNDAGAFDFADDNLQLLDHNLDRVDILVSDGILTLKRGEPYATFEWTADMQLDTSAGDYPIDSKSDDSDTSDTTPILSASNSGVAYEYHGVKPVKTGTKTADTGTGTMSLSGVDGTVKWGVVPDSFSNNESRALTTNTVERQLLQRRKL